MEYVDGTKIESKANKYTFVWRKNVERNIDKLKRQLAVLLSQVDDAIAQDNAIKPESIEITPAIICEITSRLKEELSKEAPQAKEAKKALREKKKQIKEIEKRRSLLQIMNRRRKRSARETPSARRTPMPPSCA